MLKKSFIIPIHLMLLTSAGSAFATQWVRTIDDSVSTVWHGTIILDDWGFTGPGGRNATQFDPINGFGNGTYNPTNAAFCISNPSACGIGQVQHVITTGPDFLTQDEPADIQGDFLSPNGPYLQANVDSLTTFFQWGYTTVAGSTFDNMLIDFDGDYMVAKDDMHFQFYNPIQYMQVVPDGGTPVGTVPDGLYDNKLAFQPYALSDARGWCGSVLASHPDAHEAMAGQVKFDVAFDVYFKNADGTYTYWSTEITPNFEMRSFGDIYLDLSTTTGGSQVMHARAVVNNTDPTVPNQSVGPNTPVGDVSWHNKVSFMGADVIPNKGLCGVLSTDWINGLRGPGVKKFDRLVSAYTTKADCEAVTGQVWQTPAFAGYAYILRADGERHIDYFDESVYGPDPMTTDSDGDGVLDYADNCTNKPNPDQKDTDGDKFGNACDGDFNNDNIVNSLDLGLFKQMYMSTGDVEADLNNDQIVNSLDLGLFKSLYMQAPGPSGLVH